MSADGVRHHGALAYEEVASGAASRWGGDFAARYRERRRHRRKPFSLETFDVYLRKCLMPYFAEQLPNGRTVSGC